MNKNFKKILLMNLLVTIMLIPEIMILSSLMSLVNNSIFWLIIGAIIFILISYTMYKIGDK